MRVYPNPASDLVRINVKGGNSAVLYKVRAMNALGQAVHSGEFYGNEMTLDCAHWIPGLYFLELEGDGIRKVEKLIVE
jgi:hypothetical protein